MVWMNRKKGPQYVSNQYFGFLSYMCENLYFEILCTVKSLLVPASTIFSGHFFSQFYVAKFGYYSRVGYYSRAGTNRDIMVT